MYDQERTRREIRDFFDKAISETTGPDVRAQRELLREYLTNDEFRAALPGFVAEINGVGGGSK